MTGRFQPVHGQHVELFEHALSSAENLVIAVTNPDSGALYEATTSTHRHTVSANPFSYFDRYSFLMAALRERGLADRISIVPFDLSRPAVWGDYVPLRARQLVRVYGPWEQEKAEQLKAAGYDVETLEGLNETRLSSSDIRARIIEGTDWESLVPSAAVPLVRGALEDHPPFGHQPNRDR